MYGRFIARFVVLVVAVSILAGCSSTATGGTISSGQPLQLRLTISSVKGECTAPVLSSGGPARACDRTGTITYELGKSLGTVKPTAIALDEEKGSGNSLTLEFNKADASTLGDVSREAMNKHLAIILAGRVISAAIVKEPVTTSELTIVFATAPEAKQVAAAMDSSKTS
jgi:hypothetical protein